MNKKLTLTRVFSALALAGLSIVGLSSGAFAESEPNENQTLNLLPDELVATPEYPNLARDRIMINILDIVYKMNLATPTGSEFIPETNTVLLSVYFDKTATVNDLYRAIEQSTEPVFQQVNIEILSVGPESIAHLLIGDSSKPGLICEAELPKNSPSHLPGLVIAGNCLSL